MDPGPVDSGSRAQENRDRTQGRAQASVDQASFSHSLHIAILAVG